MSTTNVAIGIKAILVFAHGLWMVLIIIQNLTDRGTNRSLIVKVATMQELKEDPILGNGLQWRAVAPDRADGFASLALRLVVLLQVLTAIPLVVGGVMIAGSLGSGGPRLDDATAVAGIGVLLLVVHWFVLLCGGLWFGYWMKMPTVQQVHMTMLGVAVLLALVLFAVPPIPGLVAP